jgi:hypothetical protein
MEEKLRSIYAYERTRTAQPIRSVLTVSFERRV